MGSGLWGREDEKLTFIYSWSKRRTQRWMTFLRYVTCKHLMSWERVIAVLLGHSAWCIPDGRGQQAKEASQKTLQVDREC